MRTFLARLTAALLLPVLILHNLFRQKTERMTLAYLSMHPTFQLRLLKQSGWMLLPLVSILLLLFAAIAQTL